MQKDKKIDWKDTNMSLFGSDLEKKIKQAAADGEPQWDDAGLKVSGTWVNDAGLSWPRLCALGCVCIAGRIADLAD